MSDAGESLLKFPTDLAVKVFGRNDPAFRGAVIEIVEAQFGKAYSVAELESKQASYVSLTVTVHAESRAQADALYQALVANELVLMAL
jgi:putative lipoic acid-binding regulatory protein